MNKVVTATLVFVLSATGAMACIAQSSSPCAVPPPKPEIPAGAISLEPLVGFASHLQAAALLLLIVSIFIVGTTRYTRLNVLFVALTSVIAPTLLHLSVASVTYVKMTSCGCVVEWPTPPHTTLNALFGYGQLKAMAIFAVAVSVGATIVLICRSLRRGIYGLAAHS